MEMMIALLIGVITSAGVYLLLRARIYPVVMGLTLLSYAVNLFLFISGGLMTNAPPLIVDGIERYTDPLPQALVLTAIVISFGMTAFLVVLALRTYGDNNSDHVDGKEDEA